MSCFVTNYYFGYWTVSYFPRFIVIYSIKVIATIVIIQLFLGLTINIAAVLAEMSFTINYLVIISIYSDFDSVVKYFDKWQSVI